MTGYFIALFFLFGIVFGSFFNVVIYRFPQNESFVFTRSYCPSCKKPLKFYHNVPLLSYIFLAGKCAYCSTRISIQYPFIEFLSGIIAVFFYLKFGLTADTFFYMFVFYMLLIISGIDIKTHLIKNKLLIVLFLGSLLFNFFLNHISWLVALLGAVICGGIMFAIAAIGQWYYKKESVGMGDVKLAAVFGFMFGWKVALAAIYGGYFFAALFFISIKVLKKQPISKYIPMAPFFSMGLFVIVLWGRQLFDYYIKLVT